ncbi:MAG: M15 family metallopeptidase [Lachnospiraceae bacterium]|nr:M15 family metallopeptidase [Lachnospiraceae bacterium]
MSLQILVNKTHPLPADYIPLDLTLTNVPFEEKEYSEKKLLRTTAAAALENLFSHASHLGYSFTAISGYRSYQRQQEIFSTHVEKYGLEYASQVSAKPGCSEHQTGLAMDISLPSLSYQLLPEFGDTKEGLWLAKNACHFGFILRYPVDKVHITGYTYEPWHFRYVGIPLAIHLTKYHLTMEEIE